MDGRDGGPAGALEGKRGSESCVEVCIDGKMGASEFGVNYSKVLLWLRIVQYVLDM